MRTVQELVFCFNYSSKKLLQFQESYEITIKENLPWKKNQIKNQALATKMHKLTTKSHRQTTALLNT